MAKRMTTEAPAAVMLSEASAAWLAEKLQRGDIEPRAARGYRTAVKSFLRAIGDKPAGELTHDDVEVWRRSLQHLAPATQGVYRRQIQVLLRWLRRRAFLEADLHTSPYVRARAELRAFPASIRMNAEGDGRPEILLSEAADRWLASKATLSRYTVANYHSTVSRFIRATGDMPAHALTGEDVAAWFRAQPHLAASSRANQLIALKGWLVWMHRKGFVDDLVSDMPAPRRPRHVPRALPSVDVAQLLAACPDARARAIVMVQVQLGLRCQETCGLQVADWDRAKQMLLVTKGKGGHERELPVTTAAAAAIDRYLAEHPASSGPLFRSYLNSGCGLHPNYLSELVSKWMRAAGIKERPRDGRSAHALRHTAASDVLDRCEDVRIVQDLLGHQWLSTTQIYLRGADRVKMRAAMEGRTYGADHVNPDLTPPAPLPNEIELLAAPERAGEVLDDSRLMDIASDAIVYLELYPPERIEEERRDFDHIQALKVAHPSRHRDSAKWAFGERLRLLILSDPESRRRFISGLPADIIAECEEWAERLRHPHQLEVDRAVGGFECSACGEVKPGPGVKVGDELERIDGELVFCVECLSAAAQQASLVAL